MYHLEQWKLTDSVFFERNSEYYSNLLAIYDLLSFKAVRVLKNTGAIYGAIMENNKVQPDDWSALDTLSARTSWATGCSPSRKMPPVACWRICARIWTSCSIICCC